MASPGASALALVVLFASFGGCRRAQESEPREGGGGGAGFAADLRPTPVAGGNTLTGAGVETLTAGASPEDVLPLVAVLGDPSTAGALEEVFRGLPVAARFMVLLPSSGAESRLGAEAEELGQLLTRLRGARATRGKPVVLGAGRGGSVALAYAARAPRELGAVIVAGAELPPIALPQGPPPDVGTRPLRVYIHHGSRDAVTPVARAGAASDELALRGLSAVLHLDPRGEHQLSPHLIAEMRARLTEELRDLR